MFEVDEWSFEREGSRSFLIGVIVMKQKMEDERRRDLL